MSEIKLSINKLKFIRAQVTKIFSSKSKFISYTNVEIITHSTKLKGFQKQLEELNDKILKDKLNEGLNDRDIETELESCQSYSDKIVELLTILETSFTTIRTSKTNELPQSLLKSPMALLPKFSTTEGEDLEVFLRQFEETLQSPARPTQSTQNGNKLI